jgi:xylan 1,4-beta-xylosidase
MPERSPTFRNPVLAGSHPDPSICRVGDDFYVVTSTFEYFPGLPVHHSRDLVNWRLVGHVMNRAEQLDLDGIRSSGGLYAPTIRHRGGVFYVTCTLVDGTGPSGNFVVTATDPAGPWSDPVWLPDADGFDPSLLFDDDGRAWFCAAVPQDDEGHTAVWVQEFDPDAGALVGDRHVVWHGALRGARWAEAPHIYRIRGTYYLLTAESGTSTEHAVSVARSATVTGPYDGCPRNPVLTARHLGADADVVAAGHADLVETADGEWWAVLLGVRDGERGALGRETFLVPLDWDRDGWPVFGSGSGTVQLVERRPALTPHPWPARPATDSFDGAQLDITWSFLRTPREQWWDLSTRPGHLRLRLRPEILGDAANPAYVCRRVQDRDFLVTAALEFASLAPNECAGIGVVHGADDHVRVEVCGGPDRLVRVVRRRRAVDETVATAPIGPGPLRLAIEGRGPVHIARVADHGSAWRDIGVVDAAHLSYAMSGGFFGSMVGIFATSNGIASDSVADVDWFEYTAVRRP